MPVNEKLSEIFLQLHISEKTGRGLPVVTSKYFEKAYTFDGDGILVFIPFNFIHEEGDKSSYRKHTPPESFSYEHRV